MSLLARLKSTLPLKKAKVINFNPKSAVKVNFHSSPRTPLLQQNFHNRPQRRTFFNLKIFRKPTQQDLKVKDNIPDAYALIYRNGMSKYIYGSQIVASLTAGIVCLAFAFNPNYRTYSMNYEVWSKTTKSVDNEQLILLIGFVLMLGLVQVTVSQMPLRIYKVPHASKYIAVSPGNYPMALKRSNFDRGQIVQMEESGVLPWKQNRYLIEKENEQKKVILIDQYFRRPADFAIMLGEQRDPEVEDVDQESLRK